MYQNSILVLNSPFGQNHANHLVPLVPLKFLVPKFWYTLMSDIVAVRKSRESCAAGCARHLVPVNLIKVENEKNIIIEKTIKIKKVAEIINRTRR